MSSSHRDRKQLSFAYHAQALGLSAVLKKPSCENIPALASTALSATGGESYATVRDFRWKGLVSFDEASAYVTGSEDHGAFNTLATVTVKNVNIANMVHADLVVARVTSTHAPGDEEGRITFKGSMIRGLVVAGRSIDVVLDDDPFTDEPTYAGFARKVEGRRAKNQQFHDTKKGVLSASLAAKVGDTEGFSIEIPEFGTIYVAQVIMKPSYRWISMLRFQLGCPISGALELAGAGANGVEYWP